MCGKEIGSQPCVHVGGNIKQDLHTNVLALGHEVVAECVEDAPATEVQLAFVKSGYMMEAYIPTMTDDYLEK